MRLQLPVLLLSAAIPASAFAVLGGDVSSIARDGTLQAAPAGTVARSAANGAVYQTVVTTEGVTVNEYVDNGQVYAIAWRGPAVPDLNQLMGEHFAQFRAQVQAERAARRLVSRREPVSVRNDQLVVLSAGHPGDYFGLAYLPSRVPAGIDPSQLGAQR